MPEESKIEDSSSGKSFADLYELDVELGKGAFSVVKVGHHKQSNESYAIKIITKSEMQDFDKACLKEEIGILSELRHDHIIRLYDVFEEDSYIHLILEKVDGGHLLDRLIAKEEYTECECRDVLKIVVEAVRHCHEHKIAHRDLKPENLLLMDDDCDISIKIADFGFAKVVPEGDTLTTQLGSAMHVAPEILTKTPYGTKIDMWAVGVIAYTLIGGYPPFFADNNRDLFALIMKADYDFEESSWGHVTEDCKELIAGLLQIKQADRWSADQVLDSQWMKDDPKMLMDSSLAHNLPNLRRTSVTILAADHNGSLLEAFDAVDLKEDMDHSRRVEAEVRAVVGYNRRSSLSPHLAEDLAGLLVEDDHEDDEE